ncbi:MAG TPA: PRC-barrel domain-containing protein [Gaiellaceae bacterium]
MRGQRVATLERAPVFVRGIRLGEVENVLLDEEASRILGLEVFCGDGSSRFLPYSTAHATGSGLEVASTLTLLDARELDFYRRRGRTFASVPELADAVVGPEGTLIVPLEARC